MVHTHYETNIKLKWSTNHLFSNMVTTRKLLTTKTMNKNINKYELAITNFKTW